MNEQHAATPIRYSGRRSRLSNRPEASPKPSRDFSARSSSVWHPLGVSLSTIRRSGEPLTSSYRILVCVHARGTINGKILESRSRNPAAGFHGSVLLPPLLVGRSRHLATRPFFDPSIFSPSARFRALPFRSRSRSTLPESFLLTG